MPIALTIAGSDSGGGAGIQADLRTFDRLGVYGTAAITAITAQNTLGVSSWAPVDPALVRAQIDAVATDLRPDAVKSGMLGTAAIVRTVVRRIIALEPVPYVLDPVIVSGSGSTLLDAEGVKVLARDLVPHATIVTPNLAEAAALTGRVVTDLASMERAARDLVDRHGAGAALVTGGHLAGDIVIDVFYDGVVAPARIRYRRIASRGSHGTGCTLSAALTAHLARGAPLLLAVRRAITHVRRGLRRSPGLGAGDGPLG